MLKRHDLANDGLRFDWTICQVCNRFVCYYKSTKNLLSHMSNGTGEPGVRCVGAGRKRAVKVLRVASFSALPWRSFDGKED